MSGVGPAVCLTIAILNKLEAAISSVLKRFRAGKEYIPLLRQSLIYVARIENTLVRYAKHTGYDFALSEPGSSGQGSKSGSNGGLSNMWSTLSHVLISVKECDLDVTNQVNAQSVDSLVKPTDVVDLIKKECEEMVSELESFPKEGLVLQVKRHVERLGAVVNRLAILEQRLQMCTLFQYYYDEMIAEFRRSFEQYRKSQSPEKERFTSHFDTPRFPHHLVTDFDDAATPEGRLLSSVLQRTSASQVHGTCAVGYRSGSVQGMGGVGKTSTLRKICERAEIREQFEDGVCYMEFGLEANDRKVTHELFRCVENFGGWERAKQMEQASSLDDVVRLAAKWLKDRAVLLVCDDLWKVGHVQRLKQVLRDAPTSALLISTRDMHIAKFVGNEVKFKELGKGEKIARDILGTAAFRNDYWKLTGTWDCEEDVKYVLDVCAGLPVALAIAGSAVRVIFDRIQDSRSIATVDSAHERISGDMLDALKKYASKLRRTGRPKESGPIDDYARGLENIVEASLRECETWASENNCTHKIRQLFESLCVLEKQMMIPQSALRQYWDMDEDELDEVLSRFESLGLLKLETREGSEDEGVRLHDLVLKLCRESVKHEEKWHEKLVDACGTSVPCLDIIPAKRSLTSSTTVFEQKRKWWELKNDGYALVNLTRHMAASGKARELEDLLCDVRWTICRMDLGGWSALSADFEYYFEKSSDEDKSDLRELYRVLSRSRANGIDNRYLFPFCVFGHFSLREREAEHIQRYLSIVNKHFPGPWLRPLSKCFRPSDGRELSKWKVSKLIYDTVVSWSANRVFIASGDEIIVRSLTGQQILFNIDHSAICLAVSGDGKLIVSGSVDGTVSLRDATSGDAVSEPMRGHEGAVQSVAISSDGKLIVSGSWDKTVRLWDATSGEAVGEPMRGHKAAVVSVAMSSDGKLIVSGSHDKTVRLWDATSGDAVGEPMRGHESGVGSVAISSGGKFIMSITIEGTVRWWDASSGKMVGEPMYGYHQGALLGTHYIDRAQAAKNNAEERRSNVMIHETELRLMKAMCHAEMPGEKVVLGLQNGCVIVCERVLS